MQLLQDPIALRPLRLPEDVEAARARRRRRTRSGEEWRPSSRRSSFLSAAAARRSGPVVAEVIAIHLDAMLRERFVFKPGGRLRKKCRNRKSAPRLDSRYESRPRSARRDNRGSRRADNCALSSSTKNSTPSRSTIASPGFCAIERHFVLQSGTAAFGDPHAQAFAVGFGACFQESERSCRTALSVTVIIGRAKLSRRWIVKPRPRSAFTGVNVRLTAAARRGAALFLRNRKSTI